MLFKILIIASSIITTNVTPAWGRQDPFYVPPIQAAPQVTGSAPQIIEGAPQTLTLWERSPRVSPTPTPPPPETEIPPETPVGNPHPPTSTIDVSKFQIPPERQANTHSEPAGYPKFHIDDMIDCKGRNGFNDFCANLHQLYRHLDGRLANKSIFISKAGDDDPGTLMGGGSQNIPVIARAGLYVVEIEPDPTWFEKYFDAAKMKGFMGTEMFSVVYGTSVAASVHAVFHQSLRNKHFSLAEKAREWLVNYYAIHSLVAYDARIDDAKFTMFDDVLTGKHKNSSFMNGYNLAIAGSRTYSEGVDGNLYGGQLLLSVALAHPSRRFDWEVWGWDNGVFLKSLGYAVNNTGQVNLSGINLPANYFGLTEEQRQLFVEFIQSEGTQHLDEVLNLITYPIACDMTILRTDSGTGSWFGTSTTSQSICNTNKGPYFAATMSRTGSANYLRPNVATNPAELGYSYRKGNQACATVNFPFGDVERCIDLPAGNLRYELEWKTHNRIRRVQ